MNSPLPLTNRKPARRTVDVPADVRAALNAGETSTLSLVECLVVDHSILVESTFPKLGLARHVGEVTTRLRSLPRPTAMAQTRCVGQYLAGQVPPSESARSAWQKLVLHPSDSVRCWACFVRGLATGLPFEQRLTWLKPLAADPHFGVRELAWMAIRDDVIASTAKTIKALVPLAKDRDENLRRFACEATRPRGVWASHVPLLKEQPEMALPLLQPLHNDPARYVQLSVGNWLNDAAKSRPEWVAALCDDWLARSDSAATKAIIRRGRRSLQD